MVAAGAGRHRARVRIADRIHPLPCGALAEAFDLGQDRATAVVEAAGAGRLRTRVRIADAVHRPDTIVRDAVKLDQELAGTIVVAARTERLRTRRILRGPHVATAGSSRARAVHRPTRAALRAAVGL